MTFLLLALLAQDRELVWKTYRDKLDRRDYDARVVKAGGHTMPFTLEKRGKKPEAGWPVFIAMHGGGGVPKKVNDSQWEVMQRYYQATDCLYVAPRAPTDEWNGFYTDYVYPLVTELLRTLHAFEEIDRNRVYLLGYSHGGYGAFAIGPKMADRFAAIHASAAAPTDGETAPENLMTVRFTAMIGEHDTAYGRLDRCRAFGDAIEKLRGDSKEFYRVDVTVAAGKQHSNLDDRRTPDSMASYTRNPVPRRIRWKPTDGVVRSFYWLHLPSPAKGMDLEARCDGNRIELTTKAVKKLAVLLDGRLVDLAKPVTIVVNGRRAFEGRVERKDDVRRRTLEERGDPELMFDAEIPVTID